MCTTMETRARITHGAQILGTYIRIVGIRLVGYTPDIIAHIQLMPIMEMVKTSVLAQIEI